ncbi:MAG TPA: HEAT repeat domain-containing protein [Oligoflexia bacterium]|nr:HEAT repeat domain-containing protein [Oligoflexia bacterium]HMP47197.1 HEAT repeat domain-containing protein [Oligoflexia bacterium]
MADSVPETSDLLINFNREIYSDSEFSIYEATSGNAGSRSLVLVVTGARVQDASMEVAREIRDSCELINQISRNTKGIMPILDSGVTPDLHPFFVSLFPDGDPLGSKSFSDVSDILNLADTMLNILHQLHESGVWQGGFNIRAEWYSDGDSVYLIFPGLRGVLRKVLDEGSLAPVQERAATGAFIFMNSVLSAQRDIRNLCDLMWYMADVALGEYGNVSDAKFKAVRDMFKQYSEEGTGEDFTVSSFRAFLQLVKGEIVSEDTKPLGNTHDQMKNSDYQNNDSSFSSGNYLEINAKSVSESFSEKAKEVFGRAAIQDDLSSKKGKKTIKFVMAMVVTILCWFFLSYLKDFFPEKDKINHLFTKIYQGDTSGSPGDTGEKNIDKAIVNQDNLVDIEDVNNYDSGHNVELTDSNGMSDPDTRLTFLDSISSPMNSRDMESVLELLVAEDFEIRVAAVRVLGEKAPRNNPRVLRAIELMLQDEDPLVRGFAAFSLVAYAGKDSVEMLEKHRATEKSEVVISAIFRALKRIR